ncbi:venom acid phosphatase Acph-1-like [Leptopilina heterotoma]|uniref:venom acid phosphatase Acph-1-like n=1 Tax=Leptopilina heterotoma TaxID=63436 RepID=UPI001CA94221|nr:venom acid phosphatase Acph-1-like [Leptopilina heterotoma]
MIVFWKFSTSFTIIIISYNLMLCAQSNLQLKQVNVLFRHGDRTPDTLYPGIPYTNEDYFPAGIGGLTNHGKLRAFKFGETLRQRYNDFLGSTYITRDVVAQSSDFERTKMTLQLVLAGLYPPDGLQTWKNDLNWQPIPFRSIYPITKDYIFRRFDVCQRYLEEEKRILNLSEVTKRLSRFNYLIKNMTNETKKNLTDVAHLRIFYCNLVCLKAMGFKLPQWAKNNHLQNDLLSAAIASFDLMSYNNELKKINGGGFVKIFTENMLAVKNQTSKATSKINLYSGHDMNILALYSALNLGKSHISEFSSAIIVELHQQETNYYVKIWYFLGVPSEMKQMQIPNCPILCPLECFLHQTKSVLPTDEEFKCV